MTDAAADKPDLPSVDIQQLMELLPHRAPMLLIEKMIDIVPNTSATGVKAVSMNEPYFVGHFPGHPIMPGVMIVEAMAQTAARQKLPDAGAGRAQTGGGAPDVVGYFCTHYPILDGTIRADLAARIPAFGARRFAGGGFPSGIFGDR